MIFIMMIRLDNKNISWPKAHTNSCPITYCIEKKDRGGVIMGFGYGGGYGCGYGGGYGGGFALIVVLFILLVIIGCACYN